MRFLSFLSLSGCLSALALAASFSIASAATLYQAPTNGIGGLCPTCAGTASQLGDDISLAGGPGTLTKLIWDTSNFGLGYDADIRVDLYNVDLSGSVPDLGSQFFSQTSTHFLDGGDGSPVRTFVEILLPDVAAPERFIYTIAVLNNNGSTNWNVNGSLASTAGASNPAAGEAAIGTNNETDFFFGDWVLQPGTPVGALTLQRLGMASFQLGLPGNEAFGEFSDLTPNVTFEGTTTVVPVPAALPLMLSALCGLGFMRWRNRRTG